MGASTAVGADIHTELNVAAPGWDEDGLTEPVVDRIARQAWSLLPSEPGHTPETPVAIGVLLADDAMVRDLNATFRGVDKPTNVLSFPAGEAALAEEPGSPRHLGDIALAHETVAREAQATGISVHDHAAHLIVHGLLHVVGYDHETDFDAEAMETLETRILAALGIDDPYRDTEPVAAPGSTTTAERHPSMPPA